MTYKLKASRHELPETEEEVSWREKFEEYTALIDGIDSSVAGSDEYGNLAWHVDCSATANASGNTFVEKFQSQIDTAKMILDCWEDFYPQLILTKPVRSDDEHFRCR